MEKKVTHVIGQRRDKSEIQRHFFFNESINLMALAHTHFTAHEKKVAKLKYKNGRK